MSEFQLTTETIQPLPPGLCRGVRRAAPRRPLYEAVSEGRRYPGMEHWLPLFHDRLDTLFDYLPGAPVVLEPLVEDAARERLAQIKDYYDARRARSGHRAAAARPTSRCRRTRSISAKPSGASARRRARWRADAVRGAGRAGPCRRSTRRRQGPQFRRRARRREGATCSRPWRAHVRGAAGRGQAGGDRAVERRLARAPGPRARRPRARQSDARSRLAGGAGAAARRVPLAVLGLEAGFETGDARRSSASRTSSATAWCAAKRRAKRPRTSSPRSQPDARRSRRARRPRHRPLRGAEDHRGRRRAARLPRAPLCRRRQAVPAGREHRAPVALRLGGGPRSSSTSSAAAPGRRARRA